MIELYGGKCLFCFSINKLEFAHTEPTGVQNIGRGSWVRVNDIITHKTSYILLCKPHHLQFDGLRMNDNPTIEEQQLLIAFLERIHDFYVRYRDVLV